MKIGNPALRKTFNSVQKGEMAVETRPATYMGIAAKSIYFAVMTVVAAVATVLLFNYALQIESERMLMALLIALGVSGILMLIFSLVVMFAPGTVKVAGTLYSLCQGVLLGAVVGLINLAMPGVALAAVLGTVVVFLISLVLNKFLSVRVSFAFLRALIIGLFSLVLVEMGVLIVGIITNSQFAITADFWIQFAITAFCVFYSSVMLMLDLQTADNLVKVGADKRYEWNVGFSLVTTLVYLYIEILELIIRLAMIFGKNRN